MTDQEKLKAAVDTVARHLIRHTLGVSIEFEHVSWESFPELSEADWERVVKRAEQIGDSINPASAEYDAAYGHLTERAGEHS